GRHVVDLFDRNDVQLGIILLGQRERQRQRMEGVLRAVVGVQDFAEHHSLPRSFSLARNAGERRRLRIRRRLRLGSGGGQQVARQIEGVGDDRGNDRARNDGATSAEYWPWLMIPRDRPNRAEIVPNVSPVDISSVVYIASLFGAL